MMHISTFFFLFRRGLRNLGKHWAMTIACIGLDTNSDIAIVGAMLICPLMGSVLAMAYGIATLDRLLRILVAVIFCDRPERIIV